MPYKCLSRRKEYAISYHKKLIETRKKLHICTECNQPVDVLEFTRCSICRSKEKIQRARLKILGICRGCSKRKVRKGKAQCERCAISGRLNKLNLSPEEKTKALIAIKKKNKFCHCCKSSHPKSSHDWAIDHNHITGKFRGVLCHSCNLVLGHVRDNIKILENLIKYLETIN